MKEFLLFLMGIRIYTENPGLWNKSSEIGLETLNPESYCLETMPMTGWTENWYVVDKIALMTEEIGSRTRMIGEGNITVRTEWKISTIPTNPSSS